MEYYLETLFIESGFHDAQYTEQGLVNDKCLNDISLTVTMKNRVDKSW